MCNWKKWILPGIIATVLLTILAMLMRSESIEQDLQAKATGDLASGHDWAQVALDGRDLTLSGVAPSEEDRAAALKIAENVYDVRVANSNATLIPIADPYTLSAVKDESGKITLQGSVPGKEAKAALIKKATAIAGDGNVNETLTLNRGAHEGFGALADFAIGQLAQLTTGSVELSGSDLTLKGAAPSVDIYHTVKDAAEGSLPGGGKLAGLKLTGPTASPFTFGAKKDRDGITLSGFAPSSAVRDQLVEAAKSASNNGIVTDNLQLALGEAEGFSEFAGFGVGQLANLSSGSVNFNGSSISIEGLANDVATYETLQSTLAGDIPGGGEIVSSKIVSPAISPYNFSAQKDGQGIALAGHVPDEATRSSLLSAAADATTGKVVDRLEIGEGATAGFGDLAGFGLTQLGRLKSGSISLRDLDLNISGTANSPEDYSAVSSALAGKIPGGGTLLTAKLARPAVQPYTFSAKKSAGAVELSGYMPTQEAIDAAVAKARNATGAADIINNLQLAEGVPDGFDWGGATGFAVDRLSGLSKGTALLSDTAFSLSGTASSEANLNAVNDALKNNLPSGMQIAKNEVELPTVSPFVWRFENRDGQAPRMSGYQPNAEFGDKITERIQLNFGNRYELENTLQTANGAPEGFEEAAQIAIDAVSRMASGTAEISDTSMKINGETYSDNSAAFIRQQLEKNLPAGFAGTSEIAVSDPSVNPIANLVDCQTALTDNLKFNTIRFETGKAVIRGASLGLLDRLAFAVKRCPGATVIVEGHTDSDGDPELNQRLSETRANAVRNALVADGVFAGRLKAIGYGETKPVADNSTDEGKARNRRIEFTVVQ